MANWQAYTTRRSATRCKLVELLFSAKAFPTKRMLGFKWLILRMPALDNGVTRVHYWPLLTVPTIIVSYATSKVYEKEKWRQCLTPPFLAFPLDPIKCLFVCEWKDMNGEAGCQVSGVARYLGRAEGIYRLTGLWPAANKFKHFNHWHSLFVFRFFFQIIGNKKVYKVTRRHAVTHCGIVDWLF